MAPFVGVYMFCSTSGAAEKWPHFSFPKTEKMALKTEKMAPKTEKKWPRRRHDDRPTQRPIRQTMSKGTGK